MSVRLPNGGAIVAVLLALMLWPAQLAAEDDGPTEQTRELALAFNMVSGTTQGYAALIPQLAEQAMTALRQLHPDFTEEQMQSLHQVTVEDLQARMADVHRELVLSTARHYSDDDLRELIVFFRSPLGNRYLEASGKASADHFDISARWSSNVMNSALRRAQELAAESR